MDVEVTYSPSSSKRWTSVGNRQKFIEHDHCLCVVQFNYNKYHSVCLSFFLFSSFSLLFIFFLLFVRCLLEQSRLIDIIRYIYVRVYTRISMKRTEWSEVLEYKKDDKHHFTLLEYDDEFRQANDLYMHTCLYTSIE